MLARYMLRPMINADRLTERPDGRVEYKIHGGSLFYIAISPLADPVGRVACGDSLCDGGEDPSSCPADCNGGTDDPGEPPGDDEITEPGGCSTGGGAGLLVAFAFALGVDRRRRHSR